jgi:hypothetical protein
MTAATIFTILGPLFLLLGAWRAVRSGGSHPQARSWLIIGVIFCAVAAWLHWSAR